MSLSDDKHFEAIKSSSIYLDALLYIGVAIDKRLSIADIR